MRRYRIWQDGPIVGNGERLFEPLEKRVFQEDGVRFLLNRELNAKRGGILADDMGLGKTYEMMGLVVANPVESTLIVVPPALLDQWRSCLVKYVSGKGGLHVFHGSGAKTTPAKRIFLTTYAMTGKLLKKQDIVWGRIIFDEAHHLRNSGTHIHRNALRLRSALKWGATGTPIQNSLSDFHALCNVLSLPADIEQRHEFMLRRTKASVGLFLPKIETTEVLVKWGKIEEFAREIHELAPLDVGDNNVDTIIANLSSLNWNGLVKLLRARQVCVYPRLLKDTLEERVHSNIYQIMPKMDAVIHTVKKRKTTSKLVFCHFRAEIDILAKQFREMGLSVGVIDGRVSKKKRKEILSRGSSLSNKWFDILFSPMVNSGAMDTTFIYNNVMEYLTQDVLILQIQTACEGLNLQQYQEVHFVSPHWNPAVEDQAVARCHRMGQTRPVKVFRYIMDGMMGDTVGSFDNYCKDVQNRKRKLMQLIE